MSAVYELGLAAQELISEFGGSGVYTKTVMGQYNSSTASASSSVISIPIQIVIFDLLLKNEGFGTKSGTQVHAGDKEAYVLPPSFPDGVPFSVDPTNDKITINNVTYSIVTFKEINPTGSFPVAYTFYLRR
jgi:hypothetical protein